eukprot:SM000157S02076  [mRNA]  locus=s157:186225:186785:- [translate_table: standard]
MRHIFRWLAGAAALLAAWLGLLLAADLTPAQRKVVQILPLYALVALGCYGLGALGYGVMVFPSCPKEVLLLQKDIVKATEFLEANGIDFREDGPPRSA